MNMVDSMNNNIEAVKPTRVKKTQHPKKKKKGFECPMDWVWEKTIELLETPTRHAVIHVCHDRITRQMCYLCELVIWRDESHGKQSARMYWTDCSLKRKCKEEEERFEDLVRPYFESCILQQ